MRFQENAQSQIILIRDDERNEKSKMHSLRVPVVLAFTDHNIVGPIFSKENRLPVAPFAHLSPQRNATHVLTNSKNLDFDLIE